MSSESPDLLHIDDPQAFEAAVAALLAADRDSAVSSLIRVLGHEDPWGIRHRIAVTALGAAGASEAFHEICSMTHPDRWYSIREAATLALGSMPAGDALDPLLALLQDSEYVVQCAAAQSLGMLGSEAGVPALCEMLKQQDQWGLLQGAILEALTKIKSAKATDPLVRQLKYPHNPGIVRDAIMEALVAIGPSTVSHLLRVLPAVNQATQRVISRGLYQLQETVLCDIFPGLLDAKPGSIEELKALAKGGDIRAISTVVQRIEQLQLPGSTTERFIKDQLKLAISDIFDAMTGPFVAMGPFICSTHFARFTEHKIERTAYLACRVCGETYHARKAGTVRLILARDAPVLSMADADTLVVNGLLHTEMIDCDEILIGHASDEEVVRFCMRAGNDADPFRNRNRLPCVVLQPDQLNQNTLQILQKTFIVQLPPELPVDR